MRRRYSGKRSLRRMSRKRSKRSRKSTRYRSSKVALKDIDHCKSGSVFAKAIAKGVSRKGYTCTTITTTQHTNNIPFLTYGTAMVPFHAFTSLGTPTINNMFDAFVPMQLLGTAGTTTPGFGQQEFLRHMNMYRQYRIKCIRFEYVPSNAVLGNETSMPVQGPGNAISSDDATSRIIAANSNTGSAVWVIRWPNKNGVFQDWGVNLTSTASNNAVLKNLTTLADPSVIKVPAAEKLVLFWKPKIMGQKFSMFTPTQQGINGQAAVPTLRSTAKAIRFPWMNIIDNFEQGNTFAPNSAPYTGQAPAATPGGGLTNLTSLMTPMTEPVLALYNTRTNTFIAAEEAVNYTSGRWRIDTVFEFRHKVAYAAQITATAIAPSDMYYEDEMYEGKLDT